MIMAGKGQTISQLTNRTELKGTEEIPFQEGVENGKFTAETIKKFASDVYILPGTPGIEEGWSTTDVESIVGNYDEFYEAVKSGKIITSYIDSISIMCSTERIYDDTNNTAILIFSLSAGHLVYYVEPNNMKISAATKIPVGITDDITSNDSTIAASTKLTTQLNEKILNLITNTETTTESTKELQPNTYYVFGEVETLTLTLAAGENDVLSEYMFEFTSGTTPTVITPIEGVEWRGDTIEANKVYQASIVRGIGILVGRDIA